MTLTATRSQRELHTDGLVDRLRTCAQHQRRQLVEELLATSTTVAQSIAARYRRRGVPLEDLLGSEEQGHEHAEARVALGPVVRRLSSRDKRVLRMRFFDGLPQREIAETIGVTQVQVSRLLTTVFRDLRHDLGGA